MISPSEGLCSGNTRRPCGLCLWPGTIAACGSGIEGTMDAAHCGTGTGTRARSSHDAALGSVSSFLCSVSLWPRPPLLGGSHCRCCCSPSSSFLAVAVPSVLLFHGDFQQLGARDFQWGRGPPTRFLAPEEPLRNRVVFPCWRMEKRPGDRGVLDLQSGAHPSGVGPPA